MKQFATKNYLYKSKNVLLLICLFIIKAELFSQNPPAIEWQSISWTDEDLFDNHQTQDDSGEEWWYSHKNIYNGSTHTGYISVGYSSAIVTAGSYAQAQIVYNEGANSCYNPIGNYPDATCTTTFNFGCVEDCGDRDYLGEHRGPVRGMVALNDLNGQMIWCKPITAGEIQEVIQDGNFIYVVGVAYGAKSFNNYSFFLNYNPTGGPNQYFDLSTGLFTCFPTLPNRQSRHLYMAKLDLSGNIIWENLYGIEDFVGNEDNAFKSWTYGYDLIKSSNGRIIACGNAMPIVPTDGTQVPFIIEVDPINGFVIQKKTLPVTSIVSANGTNASFVDCHTLSEFGTSQNYAVGSTYVFDANHFGYTDYNEAVVWVVDQNINPITFPLGVQNPIQIPGDDIVNKNSNIWELKYHQAKNEMMFPVIMNCSGCFAAGDNRGECRIYRYELNGALSVVGTNPSLLGEVGAFDLRAGIEETTDGGFVVVSSKHTYPGYTTPPATSSELGYLDGCTNFTNGIVIWDTDPIVAKYNSNGDKIWETTFDVSPDRARQPFPNDIKRQECLYKISEAQDGGYVISGNTSHNFDDNYLFKLYNDCSVKQVYTKTDPTDNIIDIAGSVTWSGAQAVLGSVNILTGATLTIAPGATIQFADSKLTGILTNINVQIGGKLIVSPGATLTSVAACPVAMWDGIIIQGTPGKQIAANQGWVVLSSCELKNARRGVFIGGIVKNSGGVLQATSVTFRNNYIDAEFMPYAAPLNSLMVEPNNISRFAFCNFIGDAFLNDPIYTDAFLPIGGRLTSNTHVILRSVKGIGFAGNNFKTDLTGALGSTYRTELRSTGIYSINASFHVNRACNIIGPSGCAGLKNNFDNLFHGVYAQSTNPLKTFTVDQTNFTNCYYSLYQSGINYSTITKNTFLVNTTIAAPIVPLCLGGPCLNYFDYTNQCSAFKHSENTFTVSGGQQMIGSIFNATGTLNNESFHNDYTGLLRGTQTQLTNGINGTTLTGLQIKCNRNFTTIASDILSTSGVLPMQGVCLTPTSPANNVLSHNGLPEGDIKVSASANNFFYSHFVNPPAGVQVPINYTTTKITTSSCPGIFNYATSCPLPVIGCGFPCWFGLAVDNSNSANNAKQVLLEGDAVALYNAINSGMSAGTLKNLLSSKSPYLSDGVLIAYLQRTNPPPSGHIKDIIIANSPVTSAVKTILDNMSLPNGIRNQINAAQTGTSARSQKEEQVQYYESQKDLAINEAIRIVINDTITANTDSIIESLLKFDGTIKGKTDLTNLYISKGNYGAAQHLIDSLSALPCMNKHGKLLQHCKNLHQSNKDWFELNNDVQLKIDLDSLANDSLANGFSNAKSVFAMVDGKANYELVENPTEYHSTNIIYPEEISENDDELNSELKIHAYPNPFTDEINVSLILPANTNFAKLQLIEIASGKIIEEQNVSSKQNLFKFNTALLANGVYLIAVKGENVSPSFIKVINIK